MTSQGRNTHTAPNQMEPGRTEHQSQFNPKTSVLSIMIVAGEASGDKHGASLARALTGLYPETHFHLFGSGGDEMRAAGVETLVDAREVAIIGVPEIARAMSKLYRAYRTLLNVARSRRPSAVVLIDWPDFNMRLAKKLHGKGFKIIYYIGPQVWAWRKYRVRALRRDIDRMLVILPFEEEFYKKAGVEARYVGHPLTEAVCATLSREEFCHRHGLDPTRSIFALLPGSRHKEIHYHLPLMLEAAIRLRTLPLRISDCGLLIQEGAPVRDLPNLKSQISNLKSETSSLASESSNLSSEISNLTSEISNLKSEIPNPQSAIRNPQFVIPLATTVRREQVDLPVQQAQLRARSAGGAHNGLSVSVIEGDTYNALCHSAFAVVASGTATVEAALAGTPMVIIYRGSELNWRLIRPLIHLDTFGMVNLIAGRRIVPELMQHEATGENIAREATAILSDPARLEQMRHDLKRVRDLLAAGGGSGAELAAQAVIEVIRTP
ncbi:MAG: lipid-A-disaccharide synthase [Acidobacteriota bacterium]